MSEVTRAIERVFRDEYGKVLAALIRDVRDFDVAEDCLQDALARAVETWPAHGVPDRPAAWITTTARNLAIDRLRHARVRVEKAPMLRELAKLRVTPTS